MKCCVWVSVCVSMSVCVYESLSACVCVSQQVEAVRGSLCVCVCVNLLRDSGGRGT